MALISGFGFVAQFGVLYQAICMKELIAETGNLAQLNQNRTMLNGTALDSIAEIDAQTLDAKHVIYLRCFLMVLGQWIYTNFINVYNFHTMLIGYRIKTSLSSLVYRKTLKLSKSAFANTSSGQIQNLLAGDMNRIETIFFLISYPFIGFFLSIISFVVLWPKLGWYLLVAFAVIFIIMPIQTWLGKVTFVSPEHLHLDHTFIRLSTFQLFSYQRTKAAFLTDHRINLLNEFIPAMVGAVVEWPEQRPN